MARKIPEARDYMTRHPVEVRKSTTVSEGIALMFEHEIRHLPVMGPGIGVVGMVSARDLETLLAFDVEAADSPLGEVCSKKVHKTPPQTPITEVARILMTERIGSVVIEDGGVAVGIVTLIDALKALIDAYD